MYTCSDGLHCPQHVYSLISLHIFLLFYTSDLICFIGLARRSESFFDTLETTTLQCAILTATEVNFLTKSFRLKVKY